MDASLQDIAVSMGLTGVMLSMLLMGLLITYYGSTKTRTAGFGFLVVGAALAYFEWILPSSTPTQASVNP